MRQILDDRAQELLHVRVERTQPRRARRTEHVLDGERRIPSDHGGTVATDGPTAKGQSAFLARRGQTRERIAAAKPVGNHGSGAGPAVSRCVRLELKAPGRTKPSGAYAVVRPELIDAVINGGHADPVCAKITLDDIQGAVEALVFEIPQVTP